MDTTDQSPEEGNRVAATASTGREALENLAPIVLLAAALSLALPTGFAPFDRIEIVGLPLSTLHNAAILGSALLAAFVLGVRRWINPVIGASILILAIGLTLSSRMPGLPIDQSLRTCLALAMPALFYEIRYGERLRRRLERSLPWLALLNLAISIPAFLLVERPFYRTDWGAFRLAGIVVPAGFSALALVALLFALSAARRRPAWLWLAVINYGLIVWTGTRMKILEGALLIFGWLAADWLGSRSWAGRRQRVLLALAVPLLILTYSPHLHSRFTGFWADQEEGMVLEFGSEDGGMRLGFLGRRTEDSEEGSEEDLPDTGTAEEEGTTVTITTTGRLKAWRYYWGVARENLWFGRGVGAGVVGSAGELHRSFRLPHNEYLRLLVGSGIVGLAAMLAAYLWMLGEAFSTSRNRSIRVLLVTAFAAIALDAMMANTLANQSLIIPLWIYVALLVHGDR